MKTEIPNDVFIELEKIALDELYIPTLNPLGMNKTDFHKIEVTKLQAALYKAYQCGKNSK